MATEIERKFRVVDDAWRALAEGVVYRQGYLSTEKTRTVRVRVVGKSGFLTVKGANVGATRAEFEYPIPVADANAMLDDLCETPIIEKSRYRIAQGDLTWEVDEFTGENAGLVVAEIELANEAQAFDKPAWIGEEVTGDPRFFNANLVANPFSRWSKA